MASSSKNVTMFNGKGDANSFIVKTELYIKLKKLEDEDAPMLLASRLEEPAFNVYLRMSDDDKKNIETIKTELRKQYETGNRDREEALSLLHSCHRNENESTEDYAYRIKRLVRLAYPTFADANQQVHEKYVFLHGLHPEMQVKLKGLSNFDTIDMKTLVDTTVRLEIAGVKTVVHKFKEEMNAISEGTSKATNEINLKDRVGDWEELVAKLGITGSKKFVKGDQKCFKCGSKFHFANRCASQTQRGERKC